MDEILQRLDLDTLDIPQNAAYYVCGAGADAVNGWYREAENSRYINLENEWVTLARRRRRRHYYDDGNFVWYFSYGNAQYSNGNNSVQPPFDGWKVEMENGPCPYVIPRDRLQAEKLKTAPPKQKNDATLQQIADAQNEYVAKLEEKKDAMIQRETAKCNATRREIEALEAKLTSQMQHLAEETAKFDQKLEDARAKAAEAAIKAESFLDRVVSDGLDKLNVDEVYELLHRLQVQVSKSVLQQQELSGEAMTLLTETDMEQVLNIGKLGDRRRLHINLQRLSNRQGFAPNIDTSAPGALGWGTDKVCEWLDSKGFGQCIDNFRNHRIDGPVLLHLTSDDLKSLGLSILGTKARFMKELDVIKKRTYAGQVIGESSSAAQASGLSEDQRRLVLEQVLEENAALQQQLSQRHPRRDEMPDHFMCPITNEVMEDPVFAMDGFTYERSAISTWFQRHNTSPMTRVVIPPTLVPNAVMRSEIANWE